MLFVIGWLFIIPNCFCASTSIRISQLINFEGGSNAEVINDADSDTNTWNSFLFGNTNGYWERVGGGHMTIDTSKQVSLLRPISLSNGTTKYETNSTRAVKFDDTNGEHEYLRYWFGSPNSNPTGARNKISWGYFIEFNNWTTDFRSYDMVFAEENGGGEFAGFQFYNLAGGFECALETSFSISSTITIPKAGRYWITSQWDATNSLARMAIYDPTTWRQIGTTLTRQIVNTAVRDLAIGRYDNHGNVGNTPANCLHWMDNLVIDGNGGNFPMFPASAWLAADASFSEVNGAYNSASANQYIVIPAGTNTWTAQGFTISKSGIDIGGMGTNVTKITFTQTGDDQACPFRVKASWSMLRDFQIVGPSGLDNAQAVGVLVDNGGQWYRVKNCLFLNCFHRPQAASHGTPVFGVVYKTAFANGDRFSRVSGPFDGQENYDCCFPWDSSSTNQCVYEDCIFNTTAALVTPAIGGLTSQQGALWMVRNCTFNFADGDLAPPFDSHGPTGGSVVSRGNIGVIIASNIMNFTGSGGWSELADIRGGSALIYSNIVSGFPGSATVHLRRKDTDASLYFENGGVEQVTNVYMWQNTLNGSTIVPEIDAADSTIITLNKSYFTTPPATLSVPPYPFPLRDDATAAPPPPPSGGGTFVPTTPRIRQIRIK